MEAKCTDERASRVSQGKPDPNVPQVQTHVPVAQCSHAGSRSEAACEDRDQKAVLTLPCSISLPALPAWPFLPLTSCTKHNDIGQAFFLLMCGKLKLSTSPLCHPTAGG